MGGARRDPKQVREHLKLIVDDFILKPSAFRAPPSSDASTRLADSAHASSSEGDVSHDASVQASLPQSSSKCLQTDEDAPTQQVRTSQVALAC